MQLDHQSSQVFPAYAGMSPATAREFAARLCFPRIRGDEPLNALISSGFGAFSPHTRG